MKERMSGPTPQETIRRHVEAAEDWPWHEIAGQLYAWIDRFNDRFFGREMPDAVLSFESMDHRILAAYTLRRNVHGLLYEIAFNTKHMARPLWQTLETLMHEYVHLWQQNYGEHPVSRNYHNQEFVARCEGIGLHPAIGSGCHVRPADGIFAEFLRAYGVPEPPPLPEPKLTPRGKPLDWWTDPEKRRKGRSSLRKWSCGCQNVRVGTQEFHAQCLLCGNEFRLVDDEPEQREPKPDVPRRKPTSDSGWTQGEMELPQAVVDDETDLPEDATPNLPPADDERPAWSLPHINA